MEFMISQFFLIEIILSQPVCILLRKAMFVIHLVEEFFICRALTLMKLRLKGAQKGHSLLKKKADALTVRFRQILKKIIEV